MVHRMAEEDFSELYNFLFQTPEKALGQNEGRFIPKVSKKMQTVHPMFGVVAMSMVLYKEEEAYNIAFKSIIQIARRTAECVAKSITIEMMECVLDEKDR